MAQLAYGEGDVLAGDLGLVVLKALLENGVGYLVTGWLDGSNPIDATIAACHEAVLTRRGVLLRRMREVAHVERLLAAPVATLTGRADATPVRGAVIWSGRSGMRPVLERFARTECVGPVVGLCFDPEIVRSTDAVVFDAPPNVRGIVAAIDQAFATSHAMGRPAIVLLRARALGLRGTMRCRDNVLPGDAPAFDEPFARIGDAAEALAAIEPGDVRTGDGAAAIVTPLAAFASAVRAAERLEAQAGCDEPTISVYAVAVPTVAVLAELGSALGGAREVLVLEDTNRSGAAVVRGLEALGSTARVERVAVAADTATERDVEQVVARWVLERGIVTLSAEDEQLVADVTQVRGAALVRGGIDLDRVPRRGASLGRAVSPPIAAALVLAQGVIGVPTRVRDGVSSYRTELGTMLSVVTAEHFVAHGFAAVAPEAHAGLVLVVADASTAAAAASAATAAGATVQVVDAASPRMLATTIARACSMPLGGPLVLIASMLPSLTVSAAEAGLDEELQAGDRISPAALDEQALTIVEAGDDELAGAPRVAIRDAHAVAGRLRAAAELSPAWYEVHRHKAHSATSLMLHDWRRRALRALARMEM